MFDNCDESVDIKNPLLADLKLKPQATTATEHFSLHQSCRASTKQQAKPIKIPMTGPNFHSQVEAPTVALQTTFS
jgi:hypothetical protein